MTYLIFLAGIALNAAANFTLKLLTTQNGGKLLVLATLKNPLLYVTIFCFATNILLYGLFLGRVKLAVGYPAFVGGTFVIVLSLSYFILRETLTLSQILGIVLIFAGLLLAVK